VEKSKDGTLQVNRNGDAPKAPKRRGRWDINQEGEATPAKKTAKTPTQAETKMSWDKEEQVISLIL